MPSAASKKLLKELPSPARILKEFMETDNIPDHALVLTTGATIEYALEKLLVAFFRPLGKEDYTRLFDGSANGVLGTANAKIRLAFAMELIGEEFYEALRLINDIRNVFAHTLHRIGFDNELVKRDCVQLAKYGSGLTPDTAPAKAIFLHVTARIWWLGRQT